MFRFGTRQIGQLGRVQVRQSSNAPKLQYLIDNQWKTSEATEHIEVRNPATQELVSLVPCMTQAEMNAVADSSAKGLRCLLFLKFVLNNC